MKPISTPGSPSFGVFPGLGLGCALPQMLRHSRWMLQMLGEVGKVSWLPWAPCGMVPGGILWAPFLCKRKTVSKGTSLHYRLLSQDTAGPFGGPECFLSEAKGSCRCRLRAQVGGTPVNGFSSQGWCWCLQCWGTTGLGCKVWCEGGWLPSVLPRAPGFFL